MSRHTDPLGSLASPQPRTQEIPRSRTGESVPPDTAARRSLLDTTRGALYNNFRHIYAEILYQWQEREKSAEVAKYIDQAAQVHRGIGAFLGPPCARLRSCPPSQSLARCAAGA